MSLGEELEERSCVSAASVWMGPGTSCTSPTTACQARRRSAQITVPSPWQAQFADLRMRAGIGIYRRDFEIPEDWLRQRLAPLRRRLPQRAGLGERRARRHERGRVPAVLAST